MTLQQYLSKINTLYLTGNAREHSYRGDLQNLVMAILPDVLVTNEPARVDCGAPDYVLTRKDVPIGYIEAKDIGVDLGSKTLKEQFDRYKSGLSNLVFTDYMDFHFYKDGEFLTKIAIARLENGQIVPIPGNFEQFTQLVKNFAQTVSQTIKSPTKLAQMMAGKAKLMADVIEKSLNHDDQEGKRSTIKSQMLSFQQMLIHDIDNKAFADIYSQTIAYGMFAARYHDPTLPTFSRMEAAELIPRSNPFLRKLFQDIAGFDLDIRLTWIVDELVTIFLASDVAVIMKNFGKSTKQEDPVVHFYETFLGEYNPALRKARGVWYTPQPVVNFIVRAVDDILKTEFDLPQGLADTSKIKIKKKAVTQTGTGANSKIKEVEHEVEVHKVQILDPATGTGTFLAEVVKHIHKKFEGQQGIWSKYVTNDLIPRLNGFELLMASYAMAHLKMDMLLTETGYKPTDDQRFRIFLTNSLEEAHPDTATLFSSWLSDEADQANAVKRDAPVMVVIGNPPYSVSSTNKSKWIEGLTADYKKDMKERNIQPLSDDYIKFIRFGQHFIDKNGEGVLAYISNNSFIDGIIHRQMRKHLLESFDKIYILDLHGNAKKKEVCPDGSPDQNVFDIMQGVSINLFIKTGKKSSSNTNLQFPSSGGVPEGRGGSSEGRGGQLAEVYHYNLQGKRDFKYDFLIGNSIKKIKWNQLQPNKPNFSFEEKDLNAELIYNAGFNMSELFVQNSSGIETRKDYLVISFEETILNEVIKDFKELQSEELQKKYNVNNDSRDWKVEWAKNDIITNNPKIEKILQKPFDLRRIIYTGKTKGINGYPMFNNFKHFLGKENFGIIAKRGRLLGSNSEFSHISLTKHITDKNYLADQSYVFPLYLYPENNTQQTLHGNNARIPNLNPAIVEQIAVGLGLAFTNEKEAAGNVCFANSDELRPEFMQSFAPIDLLDYIYAVLHSPTYREKYKEFLKIDFPRVPYPESLAKFQALTKWGAELRQIHLLESPTIEKYITQYPEDGDNVVVKPRYVKNSISNSPQVITSTENSPLKSSSVNSPPLEGCPTGGVVPTNISKNQLVPDTTIKSTPIFFNPILELPYNIKLKTRARELRQAENLSEVLFWMQVTKNQFYKIDFDRQRIIGSYIVDFYVKKLGLVVEIDGSSHDSKEEYDKVREEYLMSLGLKVYRIPVVEVLQNIKGVMRNLEEFIIENYGKPNGKTLESKEPPHPAGTPPKEGNLEQLPKDKNLGRVYINETQYFENVPELAWNFYIGGYQPAQKWLKDRKDRELSYEDILHYQKIIVALNETDRIMKEIDTYDI